MYEIILLNIIYPIHHLGRCHCRTCVSICCEHNCRILPTTTPARDQLPYNMVGYIHPASRACGTGTYPIGNARFAKHMTPEPERCFHHTETDATCMYS